MNTKSLKARIVKLIAWTSIHVFSMGAAAAGNSYVDSQDTSPKFRVESNSLTTALHDRIFSAPDHRANSFEQIADIAGKSATDLAARWNDAHPISLYGALVGAAATVGTYGYLNGSVKLESLGIKPQLQKELLNGHLIIGARASWGPKMAATALVGNIGTRWELHSAGILQASASLDQQGLQEMSLVYQLTRPTAALSIVAAGSYNFHTERTQATVSVMYQPTNTIDVALSSSIDSVGESSVGVNFTWRL